MTTVWPQKAKIDKPITFSGLVITIFNLTRALFLEGPEKPLQNLKPYDYRAVSSIYS